MDDVELAGQEREFLTWVRLVRQALQLGRMVAPLATVEERIRQWWGAYAEPKTQLEMRGKKSRRVAVPAVASASAPVPAIPVQGGVEFAQLAVPERFSEALRIWLMQQWYEVRIGDSLSPTFKTLTIWRRWQYMVIDEEAS